MHHAEQLSQDLLFPEAFDIWVNTLLLRKEGFFTSAKYITAKTEKEYRQLGSALAKFFGKLPIGQIHAGHLREYQRARAFCDGPWKKPAGANLIRKEIALLLRVLRMAGCWKEDDARPEFRPVAHEESDIARAMTPDEQELFLAVAGSRERWHYIRNYAVAALQTTCSTHEMRRMRIADIRLDLGIVQVGRAAAKNRHRIRSIPIETEECRNAFEALMYRAQTLGASSPQHFLFPKMDARHHYDPTKPMGDTALRNLWNEVREAAGMPWLKPNYMRHTGISRLAEAGVPIPVILSFAGHVTQKMQQHYTTISLMSQRKAASSTWGRAGERSMPPYMMGITPHNNGFQLYKKTS